MNPAPVPQHSHFARGYTIALISAAILSTTAIFIRYLTGNYQIPPLVLAVWRDALVAFTLGPVLWLCRPDILRSGRGNLLYLTGYGLVLALFNALWTISVAFNGAAVATVLVYASAAFTALLEWWFLREKVNWVKLITIGVCFTGCILVSGAWSRADWRMNWVGIVSGVFSGLGYAIYSLMGRSASKRGLNPWTTLFYTFSLATVFLLLPNLLPGRLIPGAANSPADLFWLKDAWKGWAILFILAAGPTVLGFGLYNVALCCLPASVANLIATTEPAFTAGIAYLFLGERFSRIQIFGSLMILSGVVFLKVYEARSSGHFYITDR
ncbi:MAG: DMT family transporter [Firmicutes bacterium]|nr:DMT family transporter [Bacillota bacterium]